MKKTFACAIRPNKAPSMRRGLSIISLEHSYGLYGSRIFDRTQLAPKCTPPEPVRQVVGGRVRGARPLRPLHLAARLPAGGRRALLRLQQVGHAWHLLLRHRFAIELNEVTEVEARRLPPTDAR